KTTRFIDPGTGTYPFTGKCDNDEARSLVLANRNAGSRLILHDDPGCDLKHDYAEITVHKDIVLATIDTFEKEQVDPRFTVHFVKGDDGVLDGKVSCLSVL